MTAVADRQTQVTCRRCGKTGVARIISFLFLDNDQSHILPPVGWYLILHAEGSKGAPYSECFTCSACIAESIVAYLLGPRSAPPTPEKAKANDSN